MSVRPWVLSLVIANGCQLQDMTWTFKLLATSYMQSELESGHGYLFKQSVSSYAAHDDAHLLHHYLFLGTATLQT